MTTLPVITQNAQDVYAPLRDAGVNTHSYMNQVKTAIAAGSVPSSLFLSALAAGVSTLSLASQVQAQLSASPLLKASVISFVQQLTGDITLDVSAALTASMTALTTLINAMISDFPKDANGHLLDRVFSASGDLVPVSLQAATLVNTPAALDGWLNTIS